MLLSILIATVTNRRGLFNELYSFLLKQKGEFEDVEILYECDSKEISIGAKRQKLLNRAKGKFIVFVDDDDWVHSEYVKLIRDIIINNDNIDCIGYRIEKNGSNAYYGVNMRFLQPIHIIPVLRSVALSVGFKDYRTQEDSTYSEGIRKVLKNEFTLDEIMYIYKYREENERDKFGIKTLRRRKSSKF